MASKKVLWMECKNGKVKVYGYLKFPDDYPNWMFPWSWAEFLREVAKSVNSQRGLKECGDERKEALRVEKDPSGSGETP